MYRLYKILNLIHRLILLSLRRGVFKNYYCPCTEENALFLLDLFLFIKIKIKKIKEIFFKFCIFVYIHSNKRLIFMKHFL